MPAKVLQKIVNTAFPGRRAVDLQPLTDGYRNANFRSAIFMTCGPPPNSSAYFALSTSLAIVASCMFDVPS